MVNDFIDYTAVEEYELYNQYLNKAIVENAVELNLQTNEPKADEKDVEIYQAIKNNRLQSGISQHYPLCFKGDEPLQDIETELFAFLQGKSDAEVFVKDFDNVSYMSSSDYDIQMLEIDFKEAVSSYLKDEYTPFEKEFFTELANVFVASRYYEDYYNSFSDFVQNNLGEIENLAKQGRLKEIIGDLVMAVKDLDVQYDYINTTKYPDKMVELTDYMPFEVEYLKNMCKEENIFPEQKQYLKDGELKEYTHYHFCVTKTELQAKPQLKRFINREVQYLVVAPEWTDLNKLTDNGFSSSDFKTDENAKIKISGNSLIFNIAKYDKAQYAYYVYADLLEDNEQNRRYLGVLGVADVDKFYKQQVPGLKSRWIEPSIFLPSIEQQMTAFLLGQDHDIKGKRLIVGKSNCGYVNYFDGRERGLFNAKNGIVAINFKGVDDATYKAVLADPDSIPFLSALGFGGVKTQISADATNIVDYKEILKAQYAKELEEMKAKQAIQEQKSQNVTNEYNNSIDNKRKKNHIYFENHGVSNQTQDVWCKIDERGNIRIPLFGYDVEQDKMKIYTQQTIFDYVNKNGEHKKGKLFVKDAKKAGCFGVVGIKEGTDLLEFIKNQKHINLCEGFATGMAINKITDEPVLCAMDCGNLMSVVASLNDINPNLKITIAADNDRSEVPGLNPGIEHAAQVMSKYPDIISMTYPKFGKNENGSDWCDRMLLDNNTNKTKQAFYSNVGNEIPNDIKMCL